MSFGKKIKSTSTFAIRVANFGELQEQNFHIKAQNIAMIKNYYKYKLIRGTVLPSIVQ